MVYNKSNVFLFFCLSFIGGIFVASFIPLPQLSWLGFFILGLVLTFISLRRPKLLGVAVCLIVFSGGIISFQLSFINLESNLKDLGQIEFEGVIVKEPEIRDSKINLVVKNSDIGLVLISTEAGADYAYGQVLNISGKVILPKQYNDFDYRFYLAKDKIYYLSYWPQIEILDQNQANYFYQKILKFKDKLRQVVLKSLPAPQSQILLAIFLGDKKLISDNLKEKLDKTGTRHIVAISGMHMIIWSQILLFLALGLGLWRGQSFYLVLFLLALYILMIGAPASAVRAGIMACLLLLAEKAGRLYLANRAVIFAAAVMLLINPLLLKSDVGFQLSFTAVLSIIYLKPILDNLLKRLPNFWQLKNILTLTLAAQIGVLPLLVFHFGRVSLISPLANIVIVPFLPLIMVGGLIISLTGLVSIFLAKILAWPVYLILSFVLKAIDFLSRFALATVELNISWFLIFVYYLGLYLLVMRINRKVR